MFNFGGGFPGGFPHGHGGGRSSKPVDTTGLYKELDIEKTASAAEIKKAFRKAAMKHHPDKGGDKEKFARISNAYEILGDAKKREIYDEHGEEGVKDGGGGGGGGGGMDIFDVLSGRAGRGGGRRQRRGEDVVYPLKLKLEDLYNGCTKKLRLTKNVICSSCDGKGGSAPAETCRSCRGAGAKMVVRQVGPGMIQQMQVRCDACGGEGSIMDPADECTTCRGVKTVKTKKTLEVFVNKGMAHNQKITFEGDADEAPDTIAGDVVVVLQQLDHPTFKREGNHLFYKASVTLLEALTGVELSIEHMDGRTLIVKGAAGECLSPGDFKMIRDEGMPSAANPYVRGNLYIEFDIIFPEAGALDAAAIKTLRSVLPAGAPLDVDMEAEDVEEVTLTHVNINQERQRMKQEQQREAQRQREAAGDDDEHEGQGVQCAQQ